MAKVYLVQDIPVDRETGKPKFDMTPAIKYGEIKTMFPILKQMQFSPGPLILEIKNSLKDFTSEDYLLLYGGGQVLVMLLLASPPNRTPGFPKVFPGFSLALPFLNPDVWPPDTPYLSSVPS